MYDIGAKDVANTRNVGIVIGEKRKCSRLTHDPNCYKTNVPLQDLIFVWIAF